jgi:dipeptidyl aminopeptidase/acylaminoacyl peptidase
VTAAVDHLTSAAYPLVDPRRLAVVGHSLGGWAAILAAAHDPRLRAVAACGAAVDIGALDLGPAEIEREFTRFLAVTPDEFRRQRDEAAARLDPLAAVAAIAPRPLLVVHGTADRWVPVTQARQLVKRAREPIRYEEIDGAGHDFAWQRRGLRDLVIGWLDETDV